MAESERVETRLGSLSTTTVDYGGAVVVSLAGELRGANASSARRVIDRASEECPGLVVLDLYDLEFLDPGGCAMIAALAEDDAVAARLRVLPSTSLDVSRELALRGRGALDGYRTDMCASQGGQRR